jgi:anti-sigma factor RsiW
MTLHEEFHDEWTAKLSDFLDGELTPDERYAVESHLEGCAACAKVLEELREVAARARALEPRPPLGDLWPAVAARIDHRGTRARPAAAVVPMRVLGQRVPRRLTFTLPQLAAAAVVIAAISGGVTWSLRDRAVRSMIADRSAEASRSVVPSASREPGATDREALADRPAIESVSLADDQYDAAVLDLEKALKAGREKLDPQTITIVEHNLQTIDEAIRQAREALDADPANTYLSGHLLEARRRKLDLLRRATELTSESD